MVKDRVVVRVEVDGCDKGGVCMHVEMMYPISEKVVDGCVEDAVWRICTVGVPDRYTRLTRGRSALSSLLEKYSFVDANGCAYSARPETHARVNLMNNAHKTGHVVDSAGVYDELSATPRRTRWLKARLADVLARQSSSATPGVGNCHFKSTGIAQLSERSGVCWYSSLFFSLLFSPQMYDFLLAHVTRRAKECAHCAFLRDHFPDVLRNQEVSERVRRYLYEKLDIGDSPDQPPELDGQNGCSMATILLQRLDVPVITLMAPEMEEAHIPLKDARDVVIPPPRTPRKDERALLIVRTYRSRWRVPELVMYPRDSTAARRYRLMSAFIGSEFCGHQVSVSRSCEPEMWSFSDSDAIRLGISPLCFHVPRTHAWHDVVTRAIPYSNASHNSEFCDMSPSGRHPLKVLDEHLRATNIASYIAHVDTSSSTHDLVNVDYVFQQC